MDWVKPWMQRILDMDLQFTRQRYGYEQLKNAKAEVLENYVDMRFKRQKDEYEQLKNANAKELENYMDRYEQLKNANAKELENWEEDKLVSSLLIDL